MSVFVLKIIALVTMLIDHMGAFMGTLYAGNNDMDFLVLTMRTIGRVSFPVFVFVISQSCKYTKDKRKLVLRLLVFALISQLPYALMDTKPFFPEILDLWWISEGGLNVFFTMLLGVMAVFARFFLVGKIKTPMLSESISLFVAMGLGVLAVVLDTDYNVYGVLLIYFMSMTENKLILCGLVFTFAFSLYGAAGNLRGTVFMLAALVPCLLIASYNKKRGKYSLKYMFYIIYPVHILLFYVIYSVLLQQMIS